MRHQLLAFIAAVASVSTLAQAQQPQPTRTPTTPVQPGQVIPGQPSQVGQPGQATGQRNQAGPAGQNRGRRGMNAQGQGISLEAFIAHKLKRGNEAEVELGQMASQRAESDSVKEFAQMMVKAHTEMIQKIDQLALDQTGRDTQQPGQLQPGQLQPGQVQPGQVPPGQAQPGRGTSTSTNNDAQDLQQRAGSNVRNSESNTNSEQQSGRIATSGTSQGATGTGSTPGTASPNATAGQVGQTDPNVAGRGQPGAGQASGQAAMGGMSGRVPQMLVAITDQACDNELQLTREMLEKHKGNDFEMAYIGQQIVQHTCMLAQLQALKNSGPQQLQQLVSEGERTTREHLDHAMKIAKQLGDESSSNK